MDNFYKTSRVDGHRIIMILVLCPLICLLFSSCGTPQKVITWNVELKETELPITDKCNPDAKLSSIKSGDKPVLIPESEEREARVRVLGMPCFEGEDPPIYEIPINRVKRVTYVSDPLLPPVTLDVSQLDILEGCCRQRTGLLFFDKFEIRGGIGYRGSKDSVIYPTPTGEEIYRSSFINFDRGGSSMIFKFELSGLWNLPFIDRTNRLQAGILTGLWPTDESLFIPVGLNLRYTLNQMPARYADNCNSWYMYATAGLPLDFQTNAPLFGSSSKYQRIFYGLGLGYDIAVTCAMDFSIDLGYRYMNLPLPEIECCTTAPTDKRNPFRSSNSLLLRFGLTF